MIQSDTEQDETSSRSPTNGKRYQVEDVGTGDRFGNHTFSEACSRTQVMSRNWQYKKVFVVKEATPS